MGEFSTTEITGLRDGAGERGRGPAWSKGQVDPELVVPGHRLPGAPAEASAIGAKGEMTWG
ncbi:hypothetical protein [Streptomyces neyagawaensis]|uniref:Uncharacterized protein n=1 Tax=Streptomyces neyagawaensis TaxID=42238 RepID=A0ABV3AQI5_9ACTN